MPENADTTLPDNQVGNTARATWNFSADAVVANTAHYSAEARELLRWCFHFCIDPRHPIRREEFARRVGYSDNLIFKIFTGSYRHPKTGEQMDCPGKLLTAMKQFKSVEMERLLLGQTSFVMTPTVEAIFELCDLARESQTPGFLFGASRIGKTKALEQYTLRNNHGGTSYARMGAASGLHGMMRIIANAVGVSPKAECKKLIDRVKKAITPNQLVILDEVHLLVYTYRRESFFACVEVLREIYDECRCGMVLCATNLGRDKFERERRTELEQLFRRGVHRLELGSMPTMADLSAILADHSLQFPKQADKITLGSVVEKPFALIRQLAREEGLTAITERLRYASKIAALNREPLSWETFVEAHLTIQAKATPPQPW